MKKQIVVVALLALIALGAGYGISKWMNRGIVMQEEVQISAEERAAAEAELADAEKRIKDLPRDAESSAKYSAYIAAADAYLKLGRYRDAENAIKKVLEDNKDNQNLWFRLAEIQEKMHKYNDAYLSYKSAVEIDKENIEAWKKFFALVNSGKVENMNVIEVDRLFNDAFFMSGFNVDIIVAYAKFLEAQNNPSGAANQYRLALLQQPDNKEFKAEAERLEKAALESPEAKELFKK